VSDQEEKQVITKAAADGDSAAYSAEAESKSHKFLEAAELPSISKPLTKKSLVATAAAIKRSGVVYLSRIPPFMKPTKLRSLLEPYGAINRIFLTPEDPSSHARRVSNGGNKKRSFTDGWVETKQMPKKPVSFSMRELLVGRRAHITMTTFGTCCT
jgi:ESF2/ABP1 family protein